MAETCDILVIGAGAAGMPTALMAAQGGARVMLVDADDCVGGAFHLSSGQMSAAGTRLQAAKSILDTPDDHFADIMRISGNTADPALVRLAVDNAADTLHWLLDNGLELLPEHPIVHHGHEPYGTPRTYWGPDEGRSVLNVLQPMVERAVDAGCIDLRLGVRLEALERLPDGRIRGDLRGGSGPLAVAARATVLATGGYTADPVLFSKLSGGKPLHGGGHPMARGEGLIAAVGIGAATVNEAVHLPAFAAVEVPGAHGGVAMITQTYPQSRQPWEIYVDGGGRRFVAEDEPSVDARERALLAIEGMMFWAIFDERIKREAPPFLVRSNPRDGTPDFDSLPGYRQAASLEELATKTGLDPVALKATVNAYNSDLMNGVADPLGRAHRPSPLVEPPFHALRHLGWSIVGFAGLAVDGSLRVLDGDRVAIPNLYAAGEILGLGATSGNAFVGGMSVTPAMTFGRLLGQRLARELVGA